jgi:hypothetical protein
MLESALHCSGPGHEIWYVSRHYYVVVRLCAAWITADAWENQGCTGDDSQSDYQASEYFRSRETASLYDGGVVVDTRTNVFATYCHALDVRLLKSATLEWCREDAIHHAAAASAVRGRIKLDILRDEADNAIPLYGLLCASRSDPHAMSSYRIRFPMVHLNYTRHRGSMLSQVEQSSHFRDWLRGYFKVVSRADAKTDDVYLCYRPWQAVRPVGRRGQP